MTRLLLAALLALALGWVAFWWLDWLGRPSAYIRLRVRDEPEDPYPVQGPDPYVVGLGS